VSRPLERLPETAELQAFVTAAEERSIRAAARRLRLSPAGLAKRLDHLEAVLGRRLLLRGPLGLELTAAGRELHARAARILDEARSLRGVGVERADARLDGVQRLLGRHGERATAAILADTERLLAALFETCPEPLALVDVDAGVVIDANGALHERLGDAGELSGARVDDYPELAAEPPLVVLELAGRSVALVGLQDDEPAAGLRLAAAS
jgi:DNA-binding transcriptional LysR family regulator